MRLPFLRSKAPSPARARPLPAASEPASEEAARTQARRRLAGALVLLAVGVIGFPLLFETQPRPLPVDTPMELRAPDAAASAALPSSRRQVTALAEPPADAGQEVAPVVALAPAEPASAMPAAVSSTASAASASPAGAAPAASAPAPARFVVQAGAYTDAAALRSARQKIERLGLESYTQVVDAGGTRRTRVRVGPLATRAEADAVAAKVRAAGLQASVLSL
jgi:DedD protein